MKYKNNRGFSLVEVLVALVVLAIALVAILNTHANSVRNSVSTWILLEASLLAQEKINELEVTGYVLEEGEEEEIEAENEYTYRRIYEEGEFENETYDEKLEWREDYFWQVFIDETDLENVAKLTVVVYSEVFVDRVPPVELVTWIPYDGFPKDEDDEED